MRWRLIFLPLSVQRRRKKEEGKEKKYPPPISLQKNLGNSNVPKPTPVNWLNTKAMDEPFLRNSANSIRNLERRISLSLDTKGGTE